MDSTALILGFVFGTVGFGFFLYGKKQRRVPPLLYGVVLMVLPYVLPDAAPLVVSTLAATAAFWVAMQRGL